MDEKHTLAAGTSAHTDDDLENIATDLYGTVVEDHAAQAETTDAWTGNNRAAGVDTVSGSSYQMLEMRWPGRRATDAASARSGSPAGNPGDPATEAADEAAFAAADRAIAARRSGGGTDPLAQPRTATYVVAACVAVLVVLTMLGGVLNVGDHLIAAHPALGWVFYLVLLALVAVGIVYPLVKVAQRPVFSLYQLRDEQGHAKRRHCRMLVDNLAANTDLTDDEVVMLEGYLQAGDEADDLLIAFFNERCVPAIDAETKRAATTAFFASAISRSPLIATVTMLSVCLDLVRAIVERCGFRPTNLGLARLYLRVMLSALVAGGIEDSDLGDLLGTLLGGGAGARAGGIVLGSATEGLVSAFLVFRVGVITKRWLTAEDGPARMAAVRRTSYREALALMRTSGFMNTVADVVKRNMGTVATSAASSFAGAAKNAAETTVGAARSAVDATATAVRTAARSTADAARSVAEDATGAARAMATATLDGARGAAESTTLAVAHAAGSTAGAVGGLASAAASAAHDAARSVTGAAHDAADAVTSRARSIREKLVRK